MSKTKILFNMKHLFIILISLLICTSCKNDCIDHEDANYLYVWEYSLTDSILKKYHKPRYVEYNVYGGRHKHSGKIKHRRHYINVDFDRTGKYDYSFNVKYYDDKCNIVNKAINTNKHLIGIFYEEYYPNFNRTFVKYK